MEDETGRVELVGDKLKEFLMVTGMIIGVLGREDELGNFHVVDISFPPYPKQITPTTSNGLNR